MPEVELYSQRQKRLRGEEFPDVFVYDEIPEKFKVQVIHIIQDSLGNPNQYYYTNVDSDFGYYPIKREDVYCQPVLDKFRLIYKSLLREYGLFELTPHDADEDYSPFNLIINFLYEYSNVEQTLDIVEILFRVVNTICRNQQYQGQAQPDISPDDAIAELNIRFRENGLGYQFENNQIIRIDSTYLHTETVKPTLQVLSNPAYKGAEEEFLKAHEHYRHQRYQECLNECLKALESTMKIICDRQNWSYNKTDTAKKLVDTCFDNKLIPSYMKDQFSSLRSLLISGVPTIRNKNSGHGQGNNNIQVDEGLASYALHLTASNILFLVKSEQKL